MLPSASTAKEPDMTIDILGHRKGSPFFGTHNLYCIIRGHNKAQGYIDFWVVNGSWNGRYWPAKGIMRIRNDANTGYWDEDEHPFQVLSDEVPPIQECRGYNEKIQWYLARLNLMVSR